MSGRWRDAAATRSSRVNIDPVYMSRKIRKFRTDKFDMKQTEILIHTTHVNGWEPAVYMSCMSQNFRLFHVSNISVRNFRIFLLMYTGSLIFRRGRFSHGVLQAGRSGAPNLHYRIPRQAQAPLQYRCKYRMSCPRSNRQGRIQRTVLGVGEILAEGPNLPPFSSFTTDLGHFILKLLNFAFIFYFMLHFYVYLVVWGGGMAPCPSESAYGNRQTGN